MEEVIEKAEQAQRKKDFARERQRKHRALVKERNLKLPKRAKQQKNMNEVHN